MRSLQMEAIHPVKYEKGLHQTILVPDEDFFMSKPTSPGIKYLQQAEKASPKIKKEVKPQNSSL